MKHYFVRYGFGRNEYRLMWSEKFNIQYWNRITRAEAIDLCKEEIQRRKVDTLFSGYADRYIYPEGFTEQDAEDLEQGKNWKVENYVVIKKD